MTMLYRLSPEKEDWPIEFETADGKLLIFTWAEYAQALLRGKRERRRKRFEKPQDQQQK